MVAQLCGVQLQKSTSYHLASNGMVERLHRMLRAALTCCDTTWTEARPLVLLSLRGTLKEKIGASSADLVHSQSLAVPGDFMEEAPLPHDHTTLQLAEHLCAHMAGLQLYTPMWHGTGKVFVHASLQCYSHIMLCIDAAQPPFWSATSKPDCVTIDYVKTLVLSTPNAAHFYDPVEYITANEASHATSVAASILITYNNTQALLAVILPPAVTMLPRAPHPTLHGQLVQQPEVPPPQPSTDYVTCSGQWICFKHPCCLTIASCHQTLNGR
ncbi:uncharacterized protein LOC126355307 [Schistocerca gregaria]|uniref:uncharacterized protein LOC126355307 n=1 Tax=Schistocerca gregaria TaxID=7010 RepID=UPI00211DFE3C|nr:uncharacterized protein LOC126355307 [Schistocerca gregaria]